MLKNAGLDPLRLTSLSNLWELAATGLCGIVIGGSLWGQIPADEQIQAIRRISEYSTFLFVRVCVDGLEVEVARRFPQEATEARCGHLDGRRFCHGTGCDLTYADLSLLQETAKLLEGAGTAGFFPLGLTEAEATLLRLVAADRRHPDRRPTIRKLGTRELVGGKSGARVFLLSDEHSQPFVAKIDEPRRLKLEIQKYQRWIMDWETSVTSLAYHSHSESAALTFRLQSAPDVKETPAPTLRDRLDQLRTAEWLDTLEDTNQAASDLYQGIARAAEQLAALNSQKADGSEGEEFWLDWPVQELANRGIKCSLVDREWNNYGLLDFVEKSISLLQPNFYRGIVHGDIHGRNILLTDRLPAFIDFACSGPGHPLVDLVRLDATVRSSAMRMLLDKRSMHDVFYEVHIEGRTADEVLRRHSAISASPLATLAIRTSAKIRETAMTVAASHNLSMQNYMSMQCVVSAHILVSRNPGSGIERLVLSIVGPILFSGE